MALQGTARMFEGRRTPGLHILLALAFALASDACAESDEALASPAAPPNLIVIVLDDADVRDFSAYEPERPISLPTLERFAREGLVFDRFYASSPVCSPTRAALLTGQYPARYGLDAVIPRESPRGLPARAPMLPRYLKERGYATAHIGKWHLGTTRDDLLPAARGFAHTVSPGEWSGYFRTSLFVDGVAQSAPTDRHLAARLTDHAIRFVREQRDGPFFLDLWYFTPHVPLQPPEEWAARHPTDDAGRYAALMGHLDEQIGRLLAELETLGLRERTAILLLSDNGGTARAHDEHELAVRGHKKGLYEGGIRSPLFVHWPGRTQPGTRSAALTITMDLFPTLIELLGDDPKAHDLDGESFASALGGEDRERSAPLFWEVKSSGAEIVHAPGAPGYLSLFAVREGPHKLVMDGRSLSLFDLDQDPGETNDLAPSRPGVVARLMGAYDAWRRRTPRIPLEVASTSGAVEATAAGHRFAGPGRVALAPDLLLDVADGNLSCRLRVGSAVRGREQRIVGKGDSWTLSLLGDGRLQLHLRDTSGAAHAWTSRAPMAGDRQADVAVSLFGLKRSRLSRVFVDGELAILARHRHPIASSSEPLSLGAEDDTAFEGTIDALACYASGLTPNDL